MKGDIRPQPKTESFGRGAPGALRRAATLGFAFFMVACATQDSTAYLTYDQARAERLFSVGFDDISNIYIEEVEIAQLAFAGLDSLTSIDPAIAVAREDGYLALARDGVVSRQFTLPSDDAPDRWGEITASVITASRDISEDLSGSEPEQLYEAVFEGVLTQLDSFSRYASREDARENRASRDGFGGIGVRIRLIEEGVLILSVMTETPAERGGLQKDDVIIAIDGTPVPGMNQREAISRLRGALRSKVTLTIDRPDADAPLIKELVRTHIIPQTISYNAENNIAHIRVSGFNQNTTRSLRERMEQAKAELGSKLQGFILDLRNNPGGLLDQSVSVSDLFVRSGRIVTTRGRHPDSHQYFEANDQDLAEGLPIVVLVNGRSASASEIVAAALQDAGRAVIIGTVSYGKGTVQTLLRLPNQGELTLTWARFHAPSGYALSRRGILPDICTSSDVAVQETLIENLRAGENLIDRALQSLNIPSGDDEAVEQLRSVCPASEDEAEIDMEIAETLLREPSLYARVLQNAPATAKLQVSKAAE